MTNSTTLKSRYVFIPLAVTVGFLATCWCRIESTNPAHLQNLGAENIDPDAQQYVVLSENIWTRGIFSRCASPPYVPDMLRTPVYPFVLGAVTQLGGAKFVYFVHCSFHCCSCLLLFILTRRLFGAQVAFW